MSQDNKKQGVVTYVADPKKGYGFVRPEGETEPIYFHASKLTNCLIEDLKSGSILAFETKHNPRGLEAVKVELIRK